MKIEIPWWLWVVGAVWIFCTLFASGYDRWSPKTDAEWAAFLLRRRYFGAFVSFARSFGWNVIGSLRSLRVLAGKLPAYLLAALPGAARPANAEQAAKLAKGLLDAAVEKAREEGDAAAKPIAELTDSEIFQAVTAGRITPEEGADILAGRRRESKVPPVALMSIAIGLILVAACNAVRQQATTAANLERKVGHASGKTLDEVCDYVSAEKLPDEEAAKKAAELDALGCESALHAQTAFAKAHEAQVAAIEASKRGDCVIGAPANLPACDLLGMAAKTYTAGKAAIDSIAAVRAAADAAGSK